MAERLLVTEPFADYAFGDRITDPKQIKRALASHPSFVVREAVPDPEPQATPPAPGVTTHTLND